MSVVPGPETLVSADVAKSLCEILGAAKSREDDMSLVQGNVTILRNDSHSFKARTRVDFSPGFEVASRRPGEGSL